MPKAPEAIFASGTHTSGRRFEIRGADDGCSLFLMAAPDHRVIQRETHGLSWKEACRQALVWLAEGEPD